MPISTNIVQANTVSAAFSGRVVMHARSLTLVMGALEKEIGVAVPPAIADIRQTTSYWETKK